MLNVGRSLRASYPLFHNLDTLRWLGPERQATTTVTARDLQAVNVPISVKAESRVVGNPSPYNIFIATPQASAQAKGMPSWYLQALPEYQAFYSFAREATRLTDLPELVQDFEQSRNKRPLIDNWKINKFQNRLPEAKNLYEALSHRVAGISAETFNTNLEKTLASHIRGTVMERIAKMFFRMNAVEYILCGIDGSNEFAVQIPSLTSWLQQWQFESISAAPDLTRGQPVVDFEIICLNKRTKEVYTARFHAEVRWSHGKFSSVEGKLYKEFNWADLPFFESLI